MKRQLTINVRGNPRPQGSISMFKVGNKTAARYPPAVWDWRHQVQQAAVNTLGDDPPFPGPVQLILAFDLSRPGSHLGTGKNAGIVKPSAPGWPTPAPDLDKLVRCINDALTDAGIWRDDSQVVAIHALKRYLGFPNQSTNGTPGVLITIEEMD